MNMKKYLKAFIGVFVFMFFAYSVVQTESEQYVKVDVLKVIDNTIIIGHGCKAIIADTSPERARNILLGMHGIIPERPTTHDTIVQILKSFNITLEKVVLERFDGNYYYAFGFFRTKEKLLKLDMMPSDGIAIAVRTGSPIYINKELLEKMGKNIC
ncbi:MAG TPA: bifunctional nuclease family protein [Nanoarchaeota archaeon]|nr:bifunctional nuclease family protein [Nanoarchaeota archaeon]